MVELSTCRKRLEDVEQELGRDALAGVAHLELVAGVPEEPLRLTVDERDPAVLADDHHRVGGRLQEPPEQFAAVPMAGQSVERGVSLCIRHRRAARVLRHRTGAAVSIGGHSGPEHPHHHRLPLT